MKSSYRTRLIVLLALIVFGAILRIYQLQRSPFTGDEAFAVRYWAASPAEVLSDLAWHEPHPFGTFFGFWAWKSLVGSSEFAMRLLPALINLLGIPAMYALARRLTRDHRIALVAALLWTINPNQIWHSQDIRNYAIWSALSVIALWLLLRASDQERVRPLDWILYILVTTLGLYTFFLEAFIVVVHGLYIVLFRRRSLRPWLLSMGVIAVLLIPWFGQLWALANSGYTGTAAIAKLSDLFTTFWPSLLFGDFHSIDQPIVGIFSLFILGFITLIGDNRARVFLLLLLIIPSFLLALASIKMNVFWSRYLIASTPAILLPVAYWFGRSKKPTTWGYGRTILAILMTLLISLPTIAILRYYYSGVLPPNGLDAILWYPNYSKAPDWYSLRDFLNANTTADDTVIMTSPDSSTGTADPAFEFYYSGPAKIITLPHPKLDIVQMVDQELASRRAIWLVMVGNFSDPIDAALAANGTLITDQWTGLRLRQYRSHKVNPNEIKAPLALSVGGGSLIGYSTEDNVKPGSTLAVLLFWQQAPSPDLHAFVHLIGPAKPDGSPLWAQNDHPPTAPGRDVYLIDLPGSLPPGNYQIEIGLYDPVTGQRVPISDQNGKVLGDSTILPTTLFIR